MGARGPKPGFKKARAAQAAAPSSLPEATNTTPPAAQQQVPPTAPAKGSKAKAAPSELSASERENPNKLSGQALREHAHRRGMAKSILADMPDEKIRTELRYITQRQYTDDALA